VTKLTAKTSPIKTREQVRKELDRMPAAQIREFEKAAAKMRSGEHSHIFIKQVK